jgi:hypothetical protein
MYLYNNKKGTKDTKNLESKYKTNRGPNNKTETTTNNVQREQTRKIKKRTTRMDFHEPLLPRNTMV